MTALRQTRALMWCASATCASGTRLAGGEGEGGRLAARQPASTHAVQNCCIPDLSSLLISPASLQPAWYGLVLQGVLDCAVRVRCAVRLGASIAWAVPGLAVPGLAVRQLTGARARGRIPHVAHPPVGPFWHACRGSPNQCFQPPVMVGPEANTLFGDCMFSTADKGSVALADELIAAARRAAYEPRYACLPVRYLSPVTPDLPTSNRLQQQQLYFHSPL